MQNQQMLEELQRQSQQMVASLQQKQLIFEKGGVRLVIRGDQLIEEIEIDGRQENRIKDVVNEAIVQTQKLAGQNLISNY